MAINGDFAIGDAYEYKLLEPLDFSKGLSALQRAKELGEARKKEQEAANLAREKMLYDRKQESDKLMAKNLADAQQQLQVEVGGVHPYLIPKIQAEQKRLGQEVASILDEGGNMTDWNNPRVAKLNQDVLAFKNAVGRNVKYYADVIESTKKGKELLQNGEELEGYDPESDNLAIIDYMNKNGLYGDPNKPFMVKGFTKKPENYTPAELQKMHDTEISTSENISVNDKMKPLGNYMFEKTQVKETSANANMLEKRITNLQARVNNGEKLTGDDRRRYESELANARSLGFADENGITSGYVPYLQSLRAKKETTESTFENTPYTPPKSESDNTSKFIRQFYGNSLIMGTKTTPVAAMPAQSDINAGNNKKTGATYLLEPAAEITGTKMNNLPGNTLGANTAWEINKEGKITPVESNQDIGGIPTDRIVYFPTDEQGRPPMSYKNSSAANKNSSGRFANSGRGYQAFAYKTDKDGNIIVVNLHKSFNGTLSERGIATELTPQEIDVINGRNQQQAPVAKPQEKKRTGNKTTTTDLGVKGEWKPKY